MISSIYFEKILQIENVIIPFKKNTNVLIGINGSGKSTIVHALHNDLCGLGENSKSVNGVHVEYSTPLGNPKSMLMIAPLECGRDCVSNHYSRWVEIYSILSKDYGMMARLEHELKKTLDCKKATITEKKLSLIGNDGYPNNYRIVNFFMGVTAILLAYSFAIVNSKINNGHKTILLLDAIESGLHISVLPHILPTLTKLHPEIQIIAATHSPSLICNIPPAFIDISNLSKFKIKNPSIKGSYNA